METGGVLSEFDERTVPGVEVDTFPVFVNASSLPQGTVPFWQFLPGKNLSQENRRPGFTSHLCPRFNATQALNCPGLSFLAGTDLRQKE